MITFKGNPLVKGKHFVYEGQTVEYQGKAFGDKHLFKLNETDLILDEDEALGLKTLKEHSLLSEQENEDDLYQIVSSYTEVQLDILNNHPSSKSLNELLNSFQEEINKLKDLGVGYQVSYSKIDGNRTYLEEMMLDFLQDTQRNISDVSMPNLYAQLNNFIYNIKNMKED